MKKPTKYLPKTCKDKRNDDRIPCAYPAGSCELCYFGPLSNGIKVKPAKPLEEKI